MVATLEESPRAAPQTAVLGQAASQGEWLQSQKEGVPRAEIQLADMLLCPLALSRRLKTLAGEYHARPCQGKRKGHRTLREL